MAPTFATYDPRYLAGILFFNEGDYFEAHEVWEDLWSEGHGAERRFYQGLIQAAVGLHHFGSGNVRGAVKLYRSSYDYMQGIGNILLGLDLTAFWQQMQRCFAALLANPEHRIPLDETLLPRITLDPPPEQWPDPSAFAGHDD